MSENRLPDYLDHIRQAAEDACSFVEGLGKEDYSSVIKILEREARLPAP